MSLFPKCRAIFFVNAMLRERRDRRDKENV
jgi:hypothetical protein